MFYHFLLTILGCSSREPCFNGGTCEDGICSCPDDYDPDNRCYSKPGNTINIHFCFFFYLVITGFNIFYVPTTINFIIFLAQMTTRASTTTTTTTTTCPTTTTTTTTTTITTTTTTTTSTTTTTPGTVLPTSYLSILISFNLSPYVFWITIPWLCLFPEDRIDGHWGDWSDWSNCPVSCGGSTQNKSRLCNNPKPENGGEECSTEISAGSTTKSCNEFACPGWLNI